EGLWASDRSPGRNCALNIDWISGRHELRLTQLSLLIQSPSNVLSLEPLLELEGAALEELLQSQAADLGLAREPARLHQLLQPSSLGVRQLDLERFHEVRSRSLGPRTRRAPLSRVRRSEAGRTRPRGRKRERVPSSTWTPPESVSRSWISSESGNREGGSCRSTSPMAIAGSRRERAKESASLSARRTWSPSSRRSSRTTGCTYRTPGRPK